MRVAAAAALLTGCLSSCEGAHAQAGRAQDGHGAILLEDWLAEQVVTLPDELVKVTFPLPLGSKLQAHFRSVACHDFRLGEVPGGEQFGASAITSHKQDDGVLLRGSRLELSCEGLLTYDGPMGLAGTARVRARTTQAAIAVRLQLRSSDLQEPLVPNQVIIDRCHADVRFEYEVVSGALADLVPAFASHLQTLANREANALVCGDALRRVSKELDRRLQQVHGLLHDYMSVPDPAVPEVDPTWLSWQDVPLMQVLASLEERQSNQSTVLDGLLQTVSADGNYCLLGGAADCFAAPRCLLGSSAGHAQGTSDRNTAAGTSGRTIAAMTPGSCLFGGVASLPPQLASLPGVGGRDEAATTIETSRNIGCRVPVPHLELRQIGVNVDEASLNVQSPENGTLVSQYLAKVATLFVGLAFHFGNSSCEVDVRITAHELAVAAVAVAGLNRSAFESVPSFDYVFPQCLAPSVHFLELVDFTAATPIGGLSLRASTQPVSPLLAALADLANDAAAVAAAYDEALLAALRGYMRREVTREVTEAVNNWASSLHQQPCPRPLGEEEGGRYKRPSVNPELAALCIQVAFGLCLLAGSVGLLLGAPLHALDAEDTNWHPRSVEVLKKLQSWLGAVPDEHGGRWFAESLCMSAAVPRPVAYMLPLGVVACVFLLLGSNFLLMAQTFVSLESDGDGVVPPHAVSVEVYQVMAYSLFYSVKRLMEDKHLHMLGYLVLVFSGILPYMKLAALLVAWVAPGHMLPGRWRGRLLFFMDQFGKYALVDIFVIQFVSGTLSTTIRLDSLSRNLNSATSLSPLFGDSGGPADTGFTGTPKVYAVLRTSQEAGFSAFVLATVGSLVAGHACLFFHNQARAAEQVHCAHLDGVELSDFAGMASVSSEGETEASKHRVPRRCIGIILLSILVLFVGGGALTAFTVTLRTPVGTLSESSHSLFGFAAALPRLSDHPNAFRTRFGQVTYILFVLVTSQAHVLLLLYCLCTARSSTQLQRMNTLLHTLFAWSAMDVALISMVVTLVEMGTSDFIPLRAKDKGLLQRIFGVTVTDHRGLEVSVSLGGGTYLLAAATVLHFFFGRVVMRKLASRTGLGPPSRHRNLVLAQPLVSAPQHGLYGLDWDDWGEDPALQSAVPLSRGGFCP